MLIHGVQAVRLMEAGVPATLILIDGVRHSFIGQTYENTRAASLLPPDATFDFLDATIGRPDDGPQINM